MSRPGLLIGDSATERVTVCPEQVASLHGAVTEQAVIVGRMGLDLSTLTQLQQHLLEGVSQSKESLSQLQSVADGLTQGMQQSEAAHSKLLQSEQAVADRLVALQAQQTQHAEAAAAAWQVQGTWSVTHWLRHTSGTAVVAAQWS
jgi:hypothetical protein